MITQVACLLCAAAVSFADDAASKKALEELQGTWKLTEFGVGDDLGVLPQQPRWVVKGNKVFYAGEELATLTLDPAGTPKVIDLALAKSKKTLEGIYVVEKDTWKICVNAEADGVKERPQEFATKDKPAFRLLVFERDKAKDGDELAGVGGFVGIQLRFDQGKSELIIVDTIPDSPARKAGLKKDDVIVKIGGGEPSSLVNAVNTIRQVKPGTEVTLSIRRDGKDLNVKVKAAVIPFRYFD
jgi:uncharacterized protein (TIGR03067 family)